MKKKWKIVILLGLLVLVAGAVFASIKISQRGVVIVETGKVMRMDLTSVVTASGEIKPRNYINIGTNAQAPAPITAIYVKEGRPRKKRTAVSTAGGRSADGGCGLVAGGREFGVGRFRSERSGFEIRRRQHSRGTGPSGP